MRTIRRSTRFKRDYKRISKAISAVVLDPLLASVILPLANNQPLLEKFRDHPLSGNWKNYRDCHVRPDLVLIYRKLDPDVLELVRLGSHSELSL